ncbi:MAG: DEAD/DEAH box helicase [Brevundimonas sp.]|uniref:DEAD/DEAH box helicase n=1 Tax=Brevundimonas TaxID=41275 RepID=UPI000DB7A14D|nr:MULTISPECIES: DEAD/DEAH box helicase [Brevundimonas]MBC1183275.1 DEAD/DEAH box helicase [Brevundimonas huaxiensis]PZU73810.1 MAG: DEAD/DEAH box helicase [Brevundimonas sp.]
MTETSFDRLHPDVRRWIRDEGWSELRPVQDEAIRTILGNDRDVVIAAATAAGKTEAAFLPLLTQAAAREETGVSVLYVAPLKALINDQHRRLDLLCERMGIGLVRWHGDAPQGPKQRVLKQPRGVVMITPESIEALLLRRSTDARRLLGSLDAIIVDELHAFLQGPRGLHLFSLLRRLELMSARRPRRIGLSATLGDMGVAAAWLNAQAPTSVEIIQPEGAAPELRLQVRGYLEPAESSPSGDNLEIDGGDEALDRIADHAFSVLRGDNALFFGGSRRNVEALSDRLLRRSERAGVPNEFFPHHGSLSKELREELETRLKAGTLPTTAIATTTLELGIDLGSVKSVAQLGAPRSLASLRQRLGRSGRRKDTPAILRIYTRERHLGRVSDPIDRLRPQVVRAVAAVRLLLSRFVETPGDDPAVVTVAIHQILSIITEQGGARADALYKTLCAAGPLAALTPGDFVELLRWIAAPEVGLIEQAPDGTLMLAATGEELTAARDFYAVFETDQEWRLIHGTRALGSIPISNVLAVGSLLAFAGRRWRVADVDDRAKVLTVTPHPAGRLPKFDRQSVEPIDDRLAAEIRAVYLDDDLPAFLDETAVQLLQEGRAVFHALDLAENALVASGADTHIFTWRGTAMNDVLAVCLTAAGLDCEAHDLGVTVSDATPLEVAAFIKKLPGDVAADDLSEFVANLQKAKYDMFAPPSLLRRLWARRHKGAVGCLSSWAGSVSQSANLLQGKTYPDLC